MANEIGQEADGIKAAWVDGAEGLSADEPGPGKSQTGRTGRRQANGARIEWRSKGERTGGDGVETMQLTTADAGSVAVWPGRTEQRRQSVGARAKSREARWRMLRGLAASALGDGDGDNGDDGDGDGYCRWCWEPATVDCG